MFKLMYSEGNFTSKYQVAKGTFAEISLFMCTWNNVHAVWEVVPCE